MTRETLGGLRHGKPQLLRPRIHIQISSPIWWPQMVLQPMLLPRRLVRYLAYMLQIWPIPFAYKSHSVFLDIPKFDIAIQDCIPLFFFC